MVRFRRPGYDGEHAEVSVNPALVTHVLPYTPGNCRIHFGTGGEKDSVIVEGSLNAIEADLIRSG
jgi:hypothetical protein